MNLIVPLYNIKFNPRVVIEIDKEIKIYPMALDIKTKLINTLPHDNFMKTFESSLRFHTYNCLDISFETNKTDVIEKAYNFLKILRICKHNSSSINLLFTINNEIEYEMRVVQIHTHKNVSEVNLSPNDIQELKLLWMNYNYIINAHTYKNRIYWATFLHELANENRQPKMQIVHDTIVLESLFSTSSQEISNQVSTRSAWFIYPKIDSHNSNLRTRYYNTIKKYYDIRSNIVHGNFGNFEKELNKLKDTKKYIEGNLNCHVRYILKTIIMDINLINIFSKKTEDFNQYLLSLVLKTNDSSTG